MADHSKPLFRWQVLAALSVVFGASWAFADDITLPRKPASMLGQPVLARPSKLQEISQRSPAIGTDVTAEYTDSQKKASRSRSTLRAARIDSAEPQSSVNEPKSPVKREAVRPTEEKIKFAGGTLTKPQRLIVEDRTPMNPGVSSRRTSSLAPTKVLQSDSITASVQVDESEAAAFEQSHSLVAAYRAAQNRVSGPLRQPKIVEVATADDGTAEVAEEVADKQVTPIDDTSLAPILSAAELPRPNRSRGAWDTSLPPSLPKAPALPSIRAASAEEEQPAVEPVKKPHRNIPLTPSRLTGSLPQAKGFVPNWSHLKKALGTQNRVAVETAAK